MVAGELNTITVIDRELLLVDVGGGSETHLARAAVHGGRAAVEDDDVMPPVAHDDVHELKWENTTLCGRTWQSMAPGSDDLTLVWQEVAFAPTCRSCLRVVDRWLPTADEPVGLNVLSAVVAERVAEFSSAYVTGVPGEHLEITRRAIRKALRDIGLRSNTHVVDDLLAVWSDDAYQALDPAVLTARLDAAFRRIGLVANDGGAVEATPPPEPINWHTWVVD